MESRIIWRNGAPFYSINGTEYVPVSYRAFWPEQNIVKQFSDKGFSLYHVFPSGLLCGIKVPYSNCGEVWLGESEYDWEALREHVDMFLEASPDAKFALLVHLDTRDWYLNENLDAMNSFENLAVMCRDTHWRQSAARFLRDIIRFMEREYPEKVYSVHLFAGHTCEWYANYPDKGLPQSELLEKSFSDWFADGRKLPTHEELIAASQGVFRHPVKNKQAVEFWEFYSEIIADTIGFFAEEVKKITDGKLLVGVFYGYTMCFFHSYLRGHNAFYSILSNPAVDMIFSPSAYKPFRGMESLNGFNLPVDSIRLHDKLYLHEIDNTTSLTVGNPYADMLQFLHQRPDSLEDSITYAKRDAARALEHGAGYWWFDMWGGWFKDESMMDQLESIKKATETIYRAGAASVSEIAVFVDARSSRYLTDRNVSELTSLPLDEEKGGVSVQNDMVYIQQDGLGRIGAPVCYYDINDIYDEHFDHSCCKLYIFLNLLAPTEQIVNCIKKLREQGKSVLFLYAPGYIGEDDFSFSAMKELTGFDFSYAEGETEGKVALCNDSDIAWGGDRGIKPLFTVKEENCEILARYVQSGMPALAVSKRKDAIDAWCACGPIPGSVLREIAKKAGVFLWHDGDDPVYINQSMIGMYSYEGGEKILTFPRDCMLTSLYDGETNHKTENKEVILRFRPKEFKLFLRE